MCSLNPGIIFTLLFINSYALFQCPAMADGEVIGGNSRTSEESKIGTEYKGDYKIINVGGPGCSTLSEESKKLADNYGAFHFCFTYQFKRNANIYTDISNAVYEALKMPFPILNYMELNQPTKQSLRFQVVNGKKYRLYKYWQHDLHHVPPPGKYTDHKFINIKDRSIDYWWKLQQRGLGKNARISGVAEVVFVPDQLFEKAKQEGYLQ